MKYLLLSLITISLAFFTTTFQYEASDNSFIGKIFHTPEVVDIAFVGDMMFDRHIRELANGQEDGYDYLLEEMTDTLNSFDVVVANLEGPVTSYPTKATYNQSDPNHYVFTFSPEIVSTLKKNNIRAVNLGNNHIHNFGEGGIRQTTDFLEKDGIGYFGGPVEKDVLVGEIGDISIGFVSFNQFLNPDKEKTLEDIQSIEDNTNFIVVYTHWGEEYEEAPNVYQRELAHSFIDAGADVVIGSHPHVVQQKEEYMGKMIYYSLGNFVFDQYFNEEVRCGGLVVLKIVKDKEDYSIQEFFTYLNSTGQTTLSSCKDSIPYVL